MPTPARSPSCRPARAEQRPAVFHDPAEHRFWTEADVEVDDLGDEHRCRQVGQGEADVGGADIGGQHDPSGGVERELGRRPPTRRRRLARCADQLAGEEGIDALGDGGAAEAGGVGELATSPWHAVAQILQQRADTFHSRK